MGMTNAKEQQDLISVLTINYQRDENGKIVVNFKGTWDELPSIAAYGSECPQDFVVKSVELDKYNTIRLKAVGMEDGEPCTLLAKDVFIGHLETITEYL